MVTAALARTEKASMGPLVTTPIGARYHPALLAQICATIDNMFPGRLLVAVGSGEAVNEAPFWNYNWPGWKERMERLCEGITLMRKLWYSKKPFQFKGKYFSLEFYYLYTKPRTKMPFYFSAVGEKAAYYAGKFGDHLVTLSPGNDAVRIREVLLPQYEKGCRAAKKKVGEVVVHVDYSFKTPEALLRDSRADLAPNVKGAVDARNPMEVERMGERLTPKYISKFVHSCKNWGQLIRILDEYKQAGASELVLLCSPTKKEIGLVAKNVLSVF